MRVQELADELLRMFPAADAESWDRVGLSVGNPEAEVTRVACALDATVESILAAQGAGCDMFPAADAESWDRVGLSVGNPEAEVTRVACALDATVESILAAQGAGCDVLLTHHPVSISPPDLLAPAAPARPSASAAMYEAVRRGVSIVSLHTNLDRSRVARDALPALLGLSADSSLEFPDEPARCGLGSVCPIEPCPLEDLASRAERAFATRALLGLSADSSLEFPDEPARCGLGSVCPIEPCPLEDLASRAERAFATRARVWGNRAAIVRRVAFMGGSLGDFGDLAIDAGCDCVIAGELGYHRAQDLFLRGLSVMLLGHDRSEQPFCSVLADAATQAGIARDCIHIIPLPTQWWEPVQGGHS